MTDHSQKKMAVLSADMSPEVNHGFILDFTTGEITDFSKNTEIVEVLSFSDGWAVVQRQDKRVFQPLSLFNQSVFNHLYEPFAVKAERLTFVHGDAQ